MANRTKGYSEADILNVILAPDEPTLSAEAARSFLKMRFSAEQERRMHELADKNNAGTISAAEKTEMDSFLRVGNFLSLIQSKARLSLKASMRN
jgi:hypothetical protein